MLKRARANTPRHVIASILSLPHTRNPRWMSPYASDVLYPEALQGLQSRWKPCPGNIQKKTTPRLLQTPTTKHTTLAQYVRSRSLHPRHFLEPLQSRPTTGEPINGFQDPDPSLQAALRPPYPGLALPVTTKRRWYVFNNTPTTATS